MDKKWCEERGEELYRDLQRIADAIEAILRLVKVDQERMKKLNEEN